MVLLFLLENTLHFDSVNDAEAVWALKRLLVDQCMHRSLLEAFEMDHVEAFGGLKKDLFLFTLDDIIAEATEVGDFLGVVSSRHSSLEVKDLLWLV